MKPTYIPLHRRTGLLTTSFPVRKFYLQKIYYHKIDNALNKTEILDTNIPEILLNRIRLSGRLPSESTQ